MVNASLETQGEIMRIRLKSQMSIQKFTILFLSAFVAVLIGMLLNISHFWGVAGGVVFLFMVFFFFKPIISILFLIAGRTCIDAFSSVNIRMPGSLATISLAGILSILLVLGGIMYITVKKVNILKLRVSRPALLFMIITLMGISLSPDFWAGMKDWLRVASIFILYIILTDGLREKKDIQVLLGAIFVSLIVPISIGFYQIFKSTGYWDQQLGAFRINAIYACPNGYASYLTLILFPFLVFGLYSSSSFRKGCFMTTSLVMLIHLYFTYTRAPVVGFLVAIFVLGLLVTKKVWVVFPLILVFAYLYPPIIGRFSELGSTYGSFMWRVNLWRHAITWFKSSPLIGHGIGSFYPIALSQLGRGIGGESHNGYATLLVETGLIGLVVALWMFIVLAKEALQIYRTSLNPYYRSITLSFILMLTAHMVTSAGSNDLFRPGLEWYLWSLAAMVHCIPSIEKQEGKKILNNKVLDMSLR